MNDPPIDDIRAVRHAMSKSINHDPQRIPELFAELQKRLADRLVNYGKSSPTAMSEELERRIRLSKENPHDWYTLEEIMQKVNEK